jgi:hypothetical protein
MFFSLYWVLLLSILGAQAPENLGTKIVTRKTLGPAGFSEQRLYIMPPLGTTTFCATPE